MACLSKITSWVGHAVLRFYVFDGGYGSLLRPCRVLLAVQDHLSGF